MHVDRQGRLRRDYQLTAAIDPLAGIRPPYPKAALNQNDVDEREWLLVDRAHTEHPRVIWWHGTKAAPRKFGAYCYLCEDYITTWARNFPITGKAKDAIARHRDWHLSRMQEGRNA